MMSLVEETVPSWISKEGMSWSVLYKISWPGQTLSRQQKIPRTPVLDTEGIEVVFHIQEWNPALGSLSVGRATRYCGLTSLVIKLYIFCISNSLRALPLQLVLNWMKMTAVSLLIIQNPDTQTDTVLLWRWAAQALPSRDNLLLGMKLADSFQCPHFWDSMQDNVRGKATFSPSWLQPVN